MEIHGNGIATLAPPCGHPYGGPPIEDCALCGIRDVAFHRQRWTTGTAPTSTAAPPCAHLGDPTGELVACPTCAGVVRLKLRACAVFGTCTEARAVAGVACCVGCPEYQPPRAEHVH